MSMMSYLVGLLDPDLAQPNATKMSRNILGILHLAHHLYNTHRNPIRSFHNVKIVGKRIEGE